MRLAHNWLRRHQRIERREGAALDSIPEPGTDGLTPELLLATERNRDLWDEVRALSSGERTVVLLDDRDELAIADIARAIGVTTGTVKTLLFRARRHLRARLALGGITIDQEFVRMILTNELRALDPPGAAPDSTRGIMARIERLETTDPAMRMTDAAPPALARLDDEGWHWLLWRWVLCSWWPASDRGSASSTADRGPAVAIPACTDVLFRPDRAGARTAAVPVRTLVFGSD